MSSTDTCTCRRFIGGFPVRGLDKTGWVANYSAAGCRLPLATILGQVGQQSVHGFVRGRIDQRPAFAPECHQAGVLKLVQMKGECRRRQPQPVADLARRQPLGAGLHQKPKHIEPGFLRERRQRNDGFFLFHISSIMELLGRVKRGRVIDDYAPNQLFLPFGHMRAQRLSPAFEQGPSHLPWY
jgi:hypothetical protein